MTNVVVASIEELEAILDKKMMPLLKEVERLRNTLGSLVANKPRINRNQVAEMLGITDKQVKSVSFMKGEKPIKKRQELAYERIGGRYMYDTAQVIAYKNKFQVVSTPDNPSR